MIFLLEKTRGIGNNLKLLWGLLFLFLSVVLSEGTANAHWWGTHFEMVKCAISILKEHVYCEFPDHYETYLKELGKNEIILKNAVRDVDLQTNGVYAIDCGCENPEEDVDCNVNGCQCSGGGKVVCNNLADISEFVFGSHYHYGPYYEAFPSEPSPSEIYFNRSDPETGKTYKDRIEKILQGYENLCGSGKENPDCFKETRSDGKLYRKLKGKTVSEKMEALRVAIDEMDAEVLADFFFNRAIKEWTWDKAQTDRRKNAIRNLGFALHLVQDVSVPEHVDPRAKGYPEAEKESPSYPGGGQFESLVRKHIDRPSEEYPEYEKYIWESYLQGGKRCPPVTDGDFSDASPSEWIRKTAKTTYDWGKKSWNPENSAAESFALGTRATVGMLFSFFLDVKPKFYVDKDVSLVNCCQYMTWKGKERINVYERADKKSEVIGTFGIGEQVKPLIVEAHVVPSRFVVHRNHTSYEGNKYKPGDVLWVFTYLGEGYFKVCFEGKLYMENLGFTYFWYKTEGFKRKRNGWGELDNDLRIIWWLKLKGDSGLSGWSDDISNFL